MLSLLLDSDWYGVHSNRFGVVLVSILPLFGVVQFCISLLSLLLVLECYVKHIKSLRVVS